MNESFMLVVFLNMPSKAGTDKWIPLASAKVSSPVRVKHTVADLKMV